MTLTLRHSCKCGVVGFCGGLLSCFCGSRSLLARKILLGEALLFSLRFPVVVSNAPAALYQAAAKLPEH